MQKTSRPGPQESVLGMSMDFLGPGMKVIRVSMVGTDMQRTWRGLHFLETAAGTVLEAWCAGADLFTDSSWTLAVYGLLRI